MQEVSGIPLAITFQIVDKLHFLTAVMTKRRYVASPVKEAIVNAVKSGRRISAVARDFAMPQKTVDNIVKRQKVRGTVGRAPKSGRPRKTTAREDKLIKRMSLADPRKTAVDIASDLRKYHHLDVHVATVKRRLNQGGLFGRHAAKKPFVSGKNRSARIKFGRVHRYWTQEEWSKVLYSDESKFELFGSDGVRFVRRPVGKRFDVRYTIPTIKHGGGSVMVWGCFSASETGPLVRIRGHLDKFQYREIMENTMVPYAEAHMPPDWIFQQDNDPKHTAKIVKKFFEDEGLSVMEWPAQSADLNPIEHLWDELERRMVNVKCKNEDELFESLKREWAAITKDRITKLIESMPRRCDAVLHSRGFSTRY